MDHVARLEFPFEIAGGGVQRVDIAVAAAEVDRCPAPRPGWRGKMSNGSAMVWFFGRMPCTPLASKRRSPAVANFHFVCAGLGVEARRTFRRSCRTYTSPSATAGLDETGPLVDALPELPTGRRLERVDVAVVAAEIDHAVLPATGEETMRSPVGKRHLTRGVFCGAVSRKHAGARGVGAEHVLGRAPAGVGPVREDEHKQCFFIGNLLRGNDAGSAAPRTVLARAALGFRRPPFGSGPRR